MAKANEIYCGCCSALIGYMSKASADVTYPRGCPYCSHGTAGTIAQMEAAKTRNLCYWVDSSGKGQ